MKYSICCLHSSFTYCFHLLIVCNLISLQREVSRLLILSHFIDIWSQLHKLATEINVTPKGVRLTEKLQLTATLYNEI